MNIITQYVLIKLSQLRNFVFSKMKFLMHTRQMIIVTLILFACCQGQTSTMIETYTRL